VVALVAVSLMSLYVRAQRWRVLLRPVGDIELYPALSATAIGFGASSVLPFRLGELLRPALLGRRAGVGMSAALSSVVLERLFDMLLVIGCFLGLALAYPIPRAMRQASWVLAAMASVGFVVLLAAFEQAIAADVVVLADLVGVVALLALRLLVEGFLVERAIARVVAGTGVACHLSSSLSASHEGQWVCLLLDCH